MGFPCLEKLWQQQTGESAAPRSSGELLRSSCASSTKDSPANRPQETQPPLGLSWPQSQSAAGDPTSLPGVHAVSAEDELRTSGGEAEGFRREARVDTWVSRLFGQSTSGGRRPGRDRPTGAQRRILGEKRWFAEPPEEKPHA